MHDRTLYVIVTGLHVSRGCYKRFLTLATSALMPEDGGSLTMACLRKLTYHGLPF